MTRRLLIEKGVFTSRAALLQDDILDQYLLENNARPSLVGEIRLGRVSTHLNGIDAAIVALGNGIDGFLRAQDWPGEKSDKPFSGRLTEGTLLPVQITKDPIDDKPYQVTGYVILENEYVVLKPQTDKLQFPKSFKDPEQKQELEKTLHSLNTGVTLRSKAAELDTDMLLEHVRELKEEWQRLLEKSVTMTTAGVISPAPSFKDRMIEKWGPTAEEIVISPPALSPLFASEGLDQELRSLDETHVELMGGGFFTIEPTEALVAIDVNSGGNEAWGVKGAPQQHANELAAKEIARELRLRNLSGMILIDFAGQQSRKEAEILTKILKKETQSDDARVEVLGASQLGLLQMTRQRTSAPLHKILNGSVAGKDTPSLRRLVELEDAILNEVSNTRSRLIKLGTGSRITRYLVDANIAASFYEQHQIQLNISEQSDLQKDQFQIVA